MHNLYYFALIMLKTYGRTVTVTSTAIFRE